MNSTHVLVKNKKTGDERTISYRSYLDTAYLFDLIGQCDQNGKLIPGDPNLEPRHRKAAVKVDAAAHAADAVEVEEMDDTGPVEEPKPAKKTISKPNKTRA